MNKVKVRMNIAIILICTLLAGVACVENDRFENIDQPCFTKESLETVPWIVDHLNKYTLPNGGGYNASVYIYHDQQFLAITTPFGCTPLGHVFSCAGVPLDSLKIDYIDFQKNMKLAAVLTGPK
ncbi:hypothetical protein [Dyadobacter beijingensis]|uniref:hypothetical protein n=1 Tax=Dyadobacter beijingensis TaxID=365489 RepID=UPI000378DF65|nr:hypothetical protein [Dyadobacter beijingensis]